MGGRGANAIGRMTGGQSGKDDVKQIIVDYGNMTQTYLSYNGQVYNARENGVIGEALETDLSLSQLAERAEQNGYTVERFNAKQYEEYLKRYAQQRAETEKILNAENVRSKVGDAINKSYRSTRRSQRIQRRNR